MYDTILLPTDGSDHALRAAEHGFFLAGAFDATVHVVNVADLRAEAGPFDAGGVDEEFRERLQADAEDAIADVRALAAGNARVETAKLEGDPKETILEYAEEQGVDLLAMGTHGRTGVRRYVAGSVCEHVLRHAPMPVLTARKTAESDPADGYDDVLVPTDGSDAANVAIDHAVAIAEACEARVHAVNVIDLGDVAASAEYSVPSHLIESLQERGRNATGEVAGRAQRAGLEVVEEVREGYPARDLVEYVEDEDVDLVAMGTAGRTGLSRFLMGSTTERTVRHSPVPVLSVNARRG